MTASNGARMLALVLLAGALSAPRARAAEPACELEGVDRIVAIGDVHGAHDRLVSVLRLAGLVDHRQRWSGGKTHLVQLGDVVDRGPDSRKVLDLLRRLEGQAAKAGGAVHTLLGNHEVMRMSGDRRYVTPGEYKAFVTPRSEEVRALFVRGATPEAREAIIEDTPLGWIEMQAAFGPQGTYGKWLRARNSVLRINGVIFLHGGISPAVAGLSCGEINAAVRRDIAGDLQPGGLPPESLARREDGPLWYRGLAGEPEDTFAASLQQILEKQKARAIVIGHTVAPEGRVRARFEGRVFQIDTGMQAGYVPTGRVSALEIRGGSFMALYEDGQERLATISETSACTGQSSSGRCPWMSHHATVSDSLEAATGATDRGEPAVHHDLDHLAVTWSTASGTSVLLSNSIR